MLVLHNNVVEARLYGIWHLIKLCVDGLAVATDQEVVRFQHCTI